VLTRNESGADAVDGVDDETDLVDLLRLDLELDLEGFSNESRLRLACF
jgi:hypothetical protein